MRQWLREGFDYDLWANRKWAPLVMGTLEEVDREEPPDEMPSEPLARAADVFAHILQGQRIWLARCGREVRSEGSTWMEALHAGWIAEVEGREPEGVVTYVHPHRGPVARPFGDIARMIVNHGTYHRGQLREIAEMAGMDFPETDFGLWRAEAG